MYPVVDRGTLLGCIGIDAIRDITRQDRERLKVADFVQPASKENTVPADMSASKLLRDIVRPATGARYMVVDEGRLVGMISLKDLLDIVSLKLEIDASS